VVTSEFVFDKAPFPACHSATLTETSEGELLCAWMGGKEEGDRDVAIWMSRKEKNGWTLPVIVADVNRMPCWNPVLFTMPTGDVLLFYKAGPFPQMWSASMKLSKDGGKSWGVEQELPAGVIGPAKNRPLLMNDGRLLCGSSIETWQRWGCYIDTTDDLGKSWKKSAPINVESNLFGIIQPALFQTKQGHIKLFARSREMSEICTAHSEDGGVSWSPARKTGLPNPNSSIDVLKMNDGRVLLAYNDTKKGRTPLVLAVSSDEGESFDKVFTLEMGAGEFSYPCLLETADHMIHVSYTWNREKIKHVVIDAKELQLPAK
ncbi:MAG: exo-alpha-sialidase, partial [Simkaniaceae bacterium]|nr:exo-alpha-sialidase [Simkaniaceae bacterium]